MFPNDNRIIYDDSERYDQPEQADHVDCQPAQIHDRNGCQHCHRDARRDPKCCAGIQEQKKQSNNQTQTHQPVVEQNAKTPRDGRRAGTNKVDGYTLRQDHLHLRRDVFHLLLNVNCIALV